MSRHHKDARYWAVEFSKISKSKVVSNVYFWIAMTIIVSLGADFGDLVDLIFYPLFIILACLGSYTEIKDYKRNKKEVVEYLSNVPKEHDYMLGKYRGFVEGWDSYKNTVKKGTG